MIGKGIATVGIWLGVGMIGLADKYGWSVVATFPAMLATFAVWIGDKSEK